MQEAPFKLYLALFQVYMEKGEFELAKEYCGNNQAHLDQVLCRQADTYFRNQEWVQQPTVYVWCCFTHILALLILNK